MHDHNPKHQSQMLMSRQLAPFFAEVESRYLGKTIYLYPASHLEHTPGDAQPVILKGITFARKHRKDTVVIRTEQEGKSEDTEMVANLVWVIREMDDSLISLEINDEREQKLVIEFSGPSQE